MSLEHLVSHTLLEDPYYRVIDSVRADGASPIAAKKLGVRCLCKVHNEGLSALDAEAGRFRDAPANVRRIAWERRAVTRRRCRPYRPQIDGLLLERWVLKTGFALAARSRSTLGDWRPPAIWADVAFGRRPVPPGQELRVVAQVGDVFGGGQEFRLRMLADESEVDGAPIGVEVNILGGWRFLLVWGRVFDECQGLVLSGDRYVDPRSETMVRPRRLSFGNPRWSTVSIELLWPS